MQVPGNLCCGWFGPDMRHGPFAFLLGQAREGINFVFLPMKTQRGFGLEFQDRPWLQQDFLQCGRWRLLSALAGVQFRCNYTEKRTGEKRTA